jgi:hypothetical protein
MKRKERKRKQASKRLVYLNTLSHTSPQNHHHTYLHSKNAIPTIVYVSYLCTHKHTSFLCNSKLMGKWQSLVEFIYVSCMFTILLVGVKSNHAIMEQDFQHSLCCCHTPWVMHIFSV